MSPLSIRTEGSSFRPGEQLSGKVVWDLEQAARAIEVRLFWYTSGKGDRDVEVVDRVRIESPAVRGESAFRFPVPESPYSFSGKLISLAWALEAVVEPSMGTARVEITVSPTGSEIILEPLQPGQRA